MSSTKGSTTTGEEDERDLPMDVVGVTCSSSSSDRGTGFRLKISNFRVPLRRLVWISLLGLILHETSSYHATLSNIQSLYRLTSDYVLAAVDYGQPERKKNRSEFHGWQPYIPLSMNCTWAQCFLPDHNCTTCRDALADMGSPPPTNDSWIPDVTMLHEMMLGGKDIEGRPWPPLLDNELCDDIDGTGGYRDRDVDKELFDRMPMTARPLVASEKTPTIMCMVYTVESKHATNIRAIRETWASYCDGFLAFSTVSDPRIPTKSVPHAGPEAYGNMWQKVRSIWQFVGNHYLEDFDFFYLGGEDLFVVPQNLKRYLQLVLDNDGGTPDDHLYLGRRFQRDNDTFNTGGAGYTLSRGTLRKYVFEGWEHPDCFKDFRGSAEDLLLAMCLRDAFGIVPMDTRDSELRERFHHFSPQREYEYQPGGGWYANYNRNWPPLPEEMCCAPESISFHYIRQPAMMRHLHALANTCGR